MNREILAQVGVYLGLAGGAAIFGGLSGGPGYGVFLILIAAGVGIVASTWPREKETK